MTVELLEIGLALLAAFGLLTLSWLLFGRLVTPLRVEEPVYTVLRAAGDGGGLEQSVNGLLWVAAGRLPGTVVVIVDAGLTPEGRQRAELLAARPEVALCRPEELAGLVG